MLVKIAEVYNVSIEWLMGFDVDKSDRDRIAIIVPDDERFRLIIQNLSSEDYVTVWEIFDRTYKKMQEKGIVP